MIKHPIYSDTLLAYFFDTKQAGALEGEGVFSAMLGSPAQGAVLKLQCLVVKNQIKNAVFKAYGNAALIAAAEYLCETIVGLSLKEAQEKQASDIAAALSLPRSLWSAALLVEDTLKTILAKAGG